MRKHFCGLSRTTGSGARTAMSARINARTQRSALLAVKTLFLATFLSSQLNAQTNTEAKPAGAEFIARMGGRGVNAHDPSTIVQCKDQYWVFYTGRGVQSYHSKDLVTWERGPRIFTQPPPWV